MTITFEKISREPAYRRISNVIEEKILARSLMPGDTLPTEMELAKQFGVNRSTVREGLRRLENTGLVKRRDGGKKLFVTRPRLTDVAAGVSRAMTLHNVTFFDVWETMMVLEPESARLAASRITAEQLAALEAIIGTAKSRPLDDNEMVEQAVCFFNQLAASTGNPVLMMSQEPLSLLLRPSLELMIGRVAQARQRIVEAQKEILNALKNKDADQAGKWMHKHILDFRRGYNLAGIDLDHVIVS